MIYGLQGTMALRNGYVLFEVGNNFKTNRSFLLLKSVSLLKLNI